MRLNTISEGASFSFKEEDTFEEHRGNWADESSDLKQSDQDEENLQKLKVQQCRLFAQKYMNMMTILFAVILSKRAFFEGSKDWNKLLFHILVVFIFMLALRIHRTSELATRLVPLLIGILSFYGHTSYLLTSKHKPHA